MQNVRSSPLRGPLYALLSLHICAVDVRCHLLSNYAPPSQPLSHPKILHVGSIAYVLLLWNGQFLVICSCVPLSGGTGDFGYMEESLVDVPTMPCRQPAARWTAVPGW